MPNHAGVGLGDADAVMAEVEALAGRHTDRSLVYGAFGAYYDGDDLPFWRRAVQAVGRRDDWIGVFGLGARIDPAALAPLPDNVLVFPWAPQMRLLERADVAMIHAGMTSVYECIHHRVPIVVFPIGDSFDQYGTAARVAHHRLGPVGDRATATTATIQGLVDQAIAEPEYGIRLRSFGEAMERHRRQRSLSAAIESMAAEAGSAPST
jgi:UDP:flavonoid glycosyltransferase YjiC (YdhE family)